MYAGSPLYQRYRHVLYHCYTGGMDTRTRIAGIALSLIETAGPAGFTTRAVCERAGVTAPTLYHHFGDIDGLVSAAIEQGFELFLERKKAQPQSGDRLVDVMRGWDDYVAFARERPRLYAAMMSRVMEGRRIEAAIASRLHLEARLERLSEVRRLQYSIRTTADIMWATAHAAAMLCIAAAPKAPAAEAVAVLRAAALGALKGKNASRGRAA